MMLSVCIVAMIMIREVACGVSPATCAPGSPAEKMAFCDPTMSYVDRAQALVNEMTVEEKLNVWLGHGLQAGVPRLNIKSYRRDTICFQGVALNSGDAPWIPPAITVFPNAINFGTSWDAGLIAKVANATSSELRGVNEIVHESSNGTMLAGPVCDVGPMANTAHDPRWGRIPQIYGEDPFLSEIMVSTMVQNLQQKQLQPKKDEKETSVKAAVTVGLFLGYHADNSGQVPRHLAKFNVTLHDLSDQFLPSYEGAMVGDKQALGIMCSHAGMHVTDAETQDTVFNVNKSYVPSCANSFILKTQLRDAWDSNAHVRADCCDDMGNMVDMGYSNTVEDAVVAATKAGMQYCFGCVNSSRDAFATALSSGRLNQSDLDNAVAHGFVNRFRLGEFERDPSSTVFGSGYKATVDSVEHRALARKLASASVVLLENPTNLLPLNPADTHSIAVIGPFGHCDEIPKTSGWRNPNCYLHNYAGVPSKVSTVVDGLQQAFPSSTVSFEESDPKVAKELATNSSVVFLALGLGDEVECEGKDRYNFSLPVDQLALLETVSNVAAHKLVLLLFAGGGIANAKGWNASSVLAVGYPGEEAGNGIADVIVGKVNPSGRLSLTWFSEEYLTKIGSLVDYSMSAGAGRTYRYLKNTSLAQYWFGYGLSYTSFSYSKAEATVFAAQKEVNVTLSVHNTGAIDGATVVQAYVQPPNVTISGPRYSLCGFSKVVVSQGDTQSVSLSLPFSCISTTGADGSRTLPSGPYTLFVGGNQPNDPHGGEVTTAMFNI
eukprot:m.44754 g.44754  ORF g.44754 m.44754 type:complete len:774 (-) comp10143_c0_seq1:12-2333(-)